MKKLNPKAIATVVGLSMMSAISAHAQAGSEASLLDRAKDNVIIATRIATAEKGADLAVGDHLTVYTNGKAVDIPLIAAGIYVGNRRDESFTQQEDIGHECIMVGMDKYYPADPQNPTADVLMICKMYQNIMPRTADELRARGIDEHEIDKFSSLYEGIDSIPAYEMSWQSPYDAEWLVPPKSVSGKPAAVRAEAHHP